MIKGVIFDVDGTLVDSVDQHAEAWRRVLARHGCDVPFAAVRGQIGKGGDQLMPVFLPGDVVERDGEAIERERGELFKREFLPSVRPFPGVAALFRRVLDRGLGIALGTSGRPEEVEHYERLLGIDGMHLARTTAEDAERSKPHPDIFHAALKALGLPGSQVAAVGDSPFDAEAAGKAGVLAIGVRCGGFPEADLRAAGCAELFDGPEDLLRRLDGSALAG